MVREGVFYKIEGRFCCGDNWVTILRTLRTPQFHPIVDETHSYPTKEEAEIAIMGLRLRAVGSGTAYRIVEVRYSITETPINDV